VESFIREAVETVRSRFGSAESLRDDPIVKAYRNFLWRLKIDPTKVRPSSEALARRILRGKNFPRINDVVDIANAVSLMTLIPIGLYDIDRISPPLILRLSRGGEVFTGIGSKVEKLKPNVPILLDSKETVLHIYPHRDSVVSSITEGIRRMLVVSAGVSGVDEELVKRSNLMVLETLLKFKCAKDYKGPWKGG